MLSNPGAIVLSTAIERCRHVENLTKRPLYNVEVVKSIGLRLQTCIAMLEYLETQTLSPLQESSAYRLLSLLQDLEILIESISDQNLIVKVWNGSEIISNVADIFEQISGSIIDLEVPNFILINKNISSVQNKLDSSLAKIKEVLSKLSSPADIIKPKTSEILSKILQCSPEAIKQSYYSFQKSFRRREKNISKKVDEFLVRSEMMTFLFEDENAEKFWNKYFPRENFVIWSKFSLAFDKEFLINTGRKNVIQILENLRMKVDPKYSGIVAKKSCNDFFSSIWNENSGEFILKPYTIITETQYLLSLEVISAPNKTLKIGTKYIINSSGPNTHLDGIFLIGRNPTEVDTYINEPSISAIHGVISYHPTVGFSYSDVGSSGGSFIHINEPIPLKPGMLIQLASTHILLIKKATVILKNPRKNSSFIENSFQNPENSITRTEKSMKKKTIINLIQELSPDLEESKISQANESFKKTSNDNLDEPPKIPHRNSIESPLSIESLDRKSDFFSEGLEEINIFTGLSELEIEFVIKSSEKGRAFKFTDSSEVITIGRDDDNSIVVNDLFISSLHAEISFTRKGWIFTDKGSSNKSWLSINAYLPFCNKSPSSSVVLEDAEQIKLGNIDFLINITC
ncbi:hypothetical protein SteCoe_25997 [Stentor coeruleus]|uniref:FHA domain-containing protein n=1 Tax=Stentor coeruleus TaxID=5963 RepID=A0A1R2BE27_9CILI|nr:hypothetical protein SteCoe_25997 [Stentor coeruleus]